MREKHHRRRPPREQPLPADRIAEEERGPGLFDDDVEEEKADAGPVNRIRQLLNQWLMAHIDALKKLTRTTT